jgi:hypothetical protein
MFIIEKMRMFFHERWKYLLLFYMVEYAISLAQTGVPSWQYWIPLKVNAVALGLGVGNGVYGSKKEREKRGGRRIPIYVHCYDSVKCTILALLLTGIYALLMSIAGAVFNFDAKPFY